MRKTQKHKQFTIEEKNQVVLLYLNQKMGFNQIIRAYKITSSSVFLRWIKQYKEFGTCVDLRGKATKKNNPNMGRPRKYQEQLESLTKEQLIERIKLYQDIKKSLAYLEKEQQSKNIK